MESMDAPSASDDAEPGQGDVVEAAWQRLLHREDMDIRLVRAAYAEPLLRRLHPSSSHQDRCTGDWSWDVPFVMHLPGGRYLVAGPSRSQTVGEADTAEEAVALVVGGLPPGCGPAVVGRREELDRLDTVPPDQKPPRTAPVR
ncbi:DUF6193 family natural product biosynthesis protein [Streptomyces griseus]|uniref:DUF6193 family natural product biosynthesis protein n=1 Tax=Streptomyces griseus TaxID=1911 RepID=UPI002D21917E|nr:DUF6193 family natural product biosynthesis protein [Streptomyces griseus]